MMFIMFIEVLLFQLHSRDVMCGPVIETVFGQVEGISFDIKGNITSNITKLNMFLGIPYAEPPVGFRRFTRPDRKAAWQRLNATKLPPSCPQTLGFLRTYSFASDYDNINEDCLYLNIYAPYNENNLTATYPVMVWIHGGSYKYGSGSEYDGRILAQEGVIVVTINYRLGVLGFLSTDDNLAPGNYGLLDQLMALQWVNDAISSFHGDPRKITIFGQSAGGGSVSLHMFSSKAAGLFTAMIPQSGCALSPWAIYRPPHKIRTYTEKLSYSLGCPTASSALMLECLRSKDATTLVNIVVSAPPMIATFAPRVDGYYITDLPEVLLSRGQYLKNISIMTGYVPQEVSEDFEDEPGIDNGLTRHQLEQLFSDKSSRYLTNADNMFVALKCAYSPSTNVFLNRDYLVDMNSDYGYVAPHIKLAEMLSSKGENIWLYEFTYRSANSLKKDWIGVPHSEELYYEFGTPFLNRTPCPGQLQTTCPVTWGTYQTWSQTDEAVSRATMKLWTDFAKLNPSANTFTSSTPSNKQLIWTRFSNTNEILLNISTSLVSEHLKWTKGLRFWNNFNYLNLSESIPDVCGSQSGVLIGR